MNTDSIDEVTQAFGGIGLHAHAVAGALTAVGAFASTPVAKTAAFTIQISDNKTLFSAVGTWALTMPSAAAAGLEFKVFLNNIGAGVISFVPIGGDLVNGAASVTCAAGYSARIISTGAAWIVHTAPTSAWASGGAASAETGATILAKLITVDGAGSGLDADLLDGLSSGAFATAAQGALAASASQPGHIHAQSDVTGLVASLAGLQPLATVLTNTTASYTTAEQSKLAGVAAGATANSPDATLLARANHTGTQPAATISDSTTAGRAMLTAATATAQTALMDVRTAALKGLAPAGGEGAAIVNFGAFPGSSDASVTITGLTGIVSGSKVIANIVATATADHSADEHVIETINVVPGNIIPGTGFTIYATNTGAGDTLLYGQWAVAFQWAA